MKKPLVIIAGPTASGKTDLAINIAKEINGEIISADSMQVYKYMNIGTAKASKEELEEVPHYLIDELYPDEDFSVAVFTKLAKKYIDDITSRGKVPILVGGTGFYINAVLYDADFKEESNDYKYRKELETIVTDKGNEHLHSMLKEVDPISAEKIHFNNIKRVIRALEFYKLNGYPISSHNMEQKVKQSHYNETFIILNMDRNLLYDRINYRVNKMFDAGLVEEVKWLIDKGYKENLTSMNGLGYKEIIYYLDGEITLEESKELLKKGTRNFAKRQLTWFKHQTKGLWLDVDKKNKLEILNEVKNEFIRNV